jgi:hypothetical protein
MLRGLFVLRSALLGIGEHLAGEALYKGVGAAPSIGREVCFAAGLAQELLRREAVLDGNLRQKQTALLPSGNQQAVAANFDVFQANLEWWRKHGDFGVELGQLVGVDGKEARVLQSGTGGAPDYGFAQGLVSLNDSNTAAEVSANVKGDKDASLFCEDTLDWDR